MSDVKDFWKRKKTVPKPLRVLAVGQTPPPYHGQGVMFKLLLDSELEDVKLIHVRMSFSSDINQVGRFQLGKIAHLFAVILRIVFCRLRFAPTILYYPPAGPNLVPLIRDIAILLSVRWMFSKTVFHFQANGISELIVRLPQPWRWLARRALLRPDGAVELSELNSGDSQYLMARHIYVVPNATYDEATRRGFIKPLRRAPSVLKILYLGTVCESKGILVLLDACAAVINQGNKLQLDVVGSFQPADFQSEVEERIVSLGLQHVVTLWGQRTGDAKWERFEDADLFCFPSYYESEGFPCVILEAMCFSLPVISTLWRGIPSIVEQGVTGSLVPPKDHQLLATEIEKYAQDTELGHRLGLAGRQRYLELFTDDKHVSLMRQVFLEVGGRDF